MVLRTEVVPDIVPSRFFVAQLALEAALVVDDDALVARRPTVARDLLQLLLEHLACPPPRPSLFSSCSWLRLPIWPALISRVLTIAVVLLTIAVALRAAASLWSYGPSRRSAEILAATAVHVASRVVAAGVAARLASISSAEITCTSEASSCTRCATEILIPLGSKAARWRSVLILPLVEEVDASAPGIPPTGRLP